METWLLVLAAQTQGEEQLERSAEVLGSPIAVPCAIPWPGLGPLSAPKIATAGRALRTTRGAALAAALRERFDEAFPLVKAPLQLVHESASALDAGLGAEALFDAADIDGGQALVDALSQLL